MTTDDVIVVDDDYLQLHLLVEHCLALGYTNVRPYQTATEALAVLRNDCSAGSLLIMDLNMPGLDGVEVLRELQAAKFPGRIVFVSGEGSRILEAAVRMASGMGLAAVGALTKPVMRDALRDAARIEAIAHLPPPPVPPRFSSEELRAALRGNELDVFYQPKVLVADCSLSGFEALMRWRHPEHGLLEPGAFLHVLESEGLLMTATRCLMRRVLVDMGELSAAGARVPVAINVAICDLERPGFCNEFMSLLKLHRASPHDIHLEVTERGVSTNALAVLNSMSRLKLQRIRLAVDDFGTGEASLLRLREFPFDYMKIDRSFVHRAASDDANRAIFDACSAMALQLGLGVVAEGVETAEDWHFVRSRKCEEAQGYFVGHPMPLQDIRGWMKQWHERLPGLTDLAA